MTNPKQMRMNDDDLDVVAAEQPDVTHEDDGELTEELADTATIEQLLDTYISTVQELFDEAIDVSLEGNSVRTHIELSNFGNDVVQMAFELRAELIAKLANRAEEIAEQGDTLRKQVIDEQEEN